jgi:hypothetical protein
MVRVGVCFACVLTLRSGGAEAVRGEKRAEGAQAGAQWGELLLFLPFELSLVTSADSASPHTVEAHAAQVPHARSGDAAVQGRRWVSGMDNQILYQGL